MTRSAASLLVLVVVALQCIGSQGDYSGPCATLPSHNISTQTAFFAIDGTYVSFYAFNSTGVPITNSWIQFAFLGVQEWWTNFSVSVNRTCYEPDSYVPPPAVYVPHLPPFIGHLYFASDNTACEIPNLLSILSLPGL